MEDAHFPELAATHAAVNAQVHDTFASALSRVEHVSGDVGELGGKIVHAVEEHTGLRLGEALGRAREVGEDAVREFTSTRAAKVGEHEAAREAGAYDFGRGRSQRDRQRRCRGFRASKVRPWQ